MRVFSVTIIWPWKIKSLKITQKNMNRLVSSRKTCSLMNDVYRFKELMLRSISIRLSSFWKEVSSFCFWKPLHSKPRIFYSTHLRNPSNSFPLFAASFPLCPRNELSGHNFLNIACDQRKIRKWSRHHGLLVLKLLPYQANDRLLFFYHRIQCIDAYLKTPWSMPSLLILQLFFYE